MTVERYIRERDGIVRQDVPSDETTTMSDQVTRPVIWTVREEFHNTATPGKLGVFVFITEPVTDPLHGLDF